MPLDTLPTLKAGDVGLVERIRVTRGPAKRLADMGFVRGIQLEMVRPGTPCIVRINGACVALGRAHQDSIQLDTP